MGLIKKFKEWKAKRKLNKEYTFKFRYYQGIIVADSVQVIDYINERIKEGGGTYTAGEGIEIVNKEINVLCDYESIETNQDNQLQVKIDNTYHKGEFFPITLWKDPDGNGIRANFYVRGGGLCITPGYDGINKLETFYDNKTLTTSPSSNGYLEVKLDNTQSNTKLTKSQKGIKVEVKIDNQSIETNPDNQLQVKLGICELEGYKFTIDENGINLIKLQNKMVFDGIEYILAKNIEPNVFKTVEFLEPSGIESLICNIPLYDGTTLTIDFNNFENFSKLSKLELNSVDENVTSIGDGFLYGCSGLTSLNLSPLSNVTSIGKAFLYGCSGLTSLNLFNRTQPIVVSNNFMYDVPLNTVIHCGQYLEQYKTAPVWSTRASQMVE